MNYKKFLTAILGMAMMVGIFSPVLILAQGASDQSGRKVCEKILNLSSKVGQRMTERGEKIDEKRSDITNKIQNRWTEQNTKLAERRERWDGNRQEHFTKLEKKAQTDAQKQALVAFKEKVTAAISVRRTAVDTAIANFRQGVEQVKISRQSAIDSAKTAYRNAVNAAFDKAKTDCDSGVAAATVRQALQDSLKAAREKYQSDYRVIETIRDAMDDLIAARKAAIEKAIQDFKTAMESARNELKSAFGQTTEGTEE